MSLKEIYAKVKIIIESPINITSMLEVLEVSHLLKITPICKPNFTIL